MKELQLDVGYHNRKVNTAAADDVTMWAFGASGSVAGFGYAANYNETKFNNKTTADYKLKSWSIGANYTIGNFVPLAQYGELKNSLTSAKDKAFLVGADYNMSKRTTLYGRWAEAKDTGNGGWDWYGLGKPVDGKKNRTLSFGVRHKF
jgi:predicted porin